LRSRKGGTLRIYNIILWTLIIWPVSCISLLAQNDVFNLQTGSLTEGQTATFPLYFKDISGSGVDTGSTNVGVLAIKVTIPPGLITQASIAKAGVIESHPVLIEADLTDLSTNTIAWYVAFTPGNVPFFNLDPPDPGEHIADLTLTAAEGTAGSQIQFNVLGPDTFIQDEFGNLTNSVENGKLTANISSIAIVPEGGGQVPQIVSFLADPTQIQPGNDSELSWEVNDADSVSISPGIGSVSASGTRSVSPGATTTYTLTATNSNGTVSAQATVTVLDPVNPTILSFSAVPSTINQGESSTLSWVTENADSISIQGLSGSWTASGNTSVAPSQSQTYTLTAQNSNGSVSRQVTVTVLVSEDKPAILSFSVTPERPEEGQTYTLSWDVDEGSAETQLLLYDQSEPGSPGLSLNQLQGQLSYEADISKTFLLRAQNVFGSVQATVFVEVLGVFEIVEFSADPMEVFQGRTANLTWFVSGADPSQVFIEPQVGVVNNDGASSGTETVVIDEETTFTLTASRGSDTLTEQLTISLREQEEGRYLYFPQIREGQEWTTEVGLINLAPESIICDVYQFDAMGNALNFNTNIRLAPLQSTSLLYDDSEGGESWIRVLNKGQGIGAVGLYGWSVIRDRSSRQIVASRASRLGQQQLLVPHIAADTVQFFTQGALAVVEENGTPDFESGGQSFQLGFLEPNQATSFDFVELMGGDLGQRGWGVLKGEVDNQQKVAGLEIFGRVPESGLSQAVGILLDNDTANQLVFPHIAKDVTQFWTGCVVINPGQNAATLQTHVFNDTGETLQGPENRTLAAGEKHVVLVDRNTNGLAEGASWAVFESDQPIFGYMLFGSYAPDDRFSGFQSAKTQAKTLCLPYLDYSTADEGGWTGLALVNPQLGKASVRLELIASDGQKKDEAQITLESNQKWVNLANNTFEVDLEKGDSVLVFSDQPLSGFEIFGKSTKTLGGMLAFSWGFE